ncbi:carbohydrate ABC transporter permease [Aliamphritea hakodatensis]|uniref:carbohydrate ABC transporter permease n=1 Tax=Aliamphritea hakodatensis TaxID=2895352 RepID=UPI0022FD7439|nr:sugar ABC transporter permease [Aliamphritea hakodatensis]
MRQRIGLLGLGFMTPALVMVLVFFLIPVVMTAVFGFTNMGTATGISGGEYLLTPKIVKQLEIRGEFDKQSLTALSSNRYQVTEEGLTRAAGAGLKSAYIQGLRDTLLGREYHSKRDFERALKKVKDRPRKVRELKKSAEYFSQSILNRRYLTENEFKTAVTETGIQLSATELEQVLSASYTGWIWTTDNFTSMFSKPDTWVVAFNTLVYVLLVLAFNIGFGLFLALTTFYLPSGQSAFFRAVWLLPRISPPVLYVLLWKWLTWDTGFISTVLGWFGVPAFNYMLGSVGSAWAVVVLINGFVGASLGMILFSSAIQAIPKSILYASEVDGANRWQQVRYIILPQLRWPILFTTSYTTLSLLTSFEYILLSTEGGPGNTTNVWALEAYFTALNNYAGNLQYGYGAAMALVLVTIGILVSLLYLRLFKFDELVARPKIEN